MKNCSLGAAISFLIHGAAALGIWALVANAPRLPDRDLATVDLALLPALVADEADGEAAAVTPPAAGIQPEHAAPRSPILPTAAPSPAPARTPPPPLKSAEPVLAASGPPSPVPAVAPAAAVPAPAAVRPESTSAAAADSEGNHADGGRAGRSPQEFAMVMDRLRRSVSYPYRARQKGWEGKVVVAFRLTRDGQAQDVRVVTSSGYALLDDSALAAVQRAAPFSPPLRDTELILPVVYALE